MNYKYDNFKSLNHAYHMDASPGNSWRSPYRCDKSNFSAPIQSKQSNTYRLNTFDSTGLTVSLDDFSPFKDTSCRPTVISSTRFDLSFEYLRIFDISRPFDYLFLPKEESIFWFSQTTWSYRATAYYESLLSDETNPRFSFKGQFFNTVTMTFKKNLFLYTRILGDSVILNFFLYRPLENPFLSTLNSSEDPITVKSPAESRLSRIKPYTDWIISPSINECFKQAPSGVLLLQKRVPQYVPHNIAIFLKRLLENFGINTRKLLSLRWRFCGNSSILLLVQFGSLNSINEVFSNVDVRQSDAQVVHLNLNDFIQTIQVDNYEEFNLIHLTLGYQQQDHSKDVQNIRQTLKDSTSLLSFSVETFQENGSLQDPGVYLKWISKEIISLTEISVSFLLQASHPKYISFFIRLDKPQLIREVVSFLKFSRLSISNDIHLNYEIVYYPAILSSNTSLGSYANALSERQLSVSSERYLPLEVPALYSSYSENMENFLGISKSILNPNYYPNVSTSINSVPSSPMSSYRPSFAANSVPNSRISSPGDEYIQSRINSGNDYIQYRINPNNEFMQSQLNGGDDYIRSRMTGATSVPASRMASFFPSASLTNEIVPWRIENGLDSRTTCMLRNIPNKYTQRMLIDFIEETHRATFDFVYLRMDFKNRCNVGYAFINFIAPQFVISFAKLAKGMQWSHFNTSKICDLTYANIQGRDALIRKFRNSRSYKSIFYIILFYVDSVMEAEPEYRPRLFYKDGPLRGYEEPFPLPDKNQQQSNLTRDF